METLVKTCFKCQLPKPLTEFYRHKAMADGYLGKCKECTKQDVSDRYSRDFAKIREYEKARFKSQDRKAKIATYQRSRRSAHPEKALAYQAVRTALKNGTLSKLPCRGCDDLDVQAHHEDYLKPLDVIWYCFQCHRKHHGQMNM